MIVQEHNAKGVWSQAYYDTGKLYRYAMVRRWQEAPHCTWVMLNPSTATERENDPTVRRCEGFSRQWGFGGYAVVNLFAYRSTDPRELGRITDPIGRDNDSMIIEMTRRAGRIVVAWGADKMAVGRGARVTQMLTNLDLTLWCLGATAAGMPRHPLYIPNSREPEVYRGG